MMEFKGAYSEILNYDWDQYEIFIDVHNEFNLDKEIVKERSRSGSKISFEKYKENYIYLKKEFSKDDNDIKDWEQFLKMCRGQGWSI